MIIAWNVYGLNKKGKLSEISLCFLELRPKIIVLLETRVKKDKYLSIRKILNLKGTYFDSYANHDNSRIWLNWDNSILDIVIPQNLSHFYLAFGLWFIWILIGI